MAELLEGKAQVDWSHVKASYLATPKAGGDGGKENSKANGVSRD